MIRFSVGLVTLAVEIGNLVSGPLLRSRRWPLLSVSEIRLPGPGLGALERLLLLRCKPPDCACWAAAIARWRSIMFSRLLDSSVLMARFGLVAPELECVRLDCLLSSPKMSSLCESRSRKSLTLYFSVMLRPVSCLGLRMHGAKTPASCATYASSAFVSSINLAKWLTIASSVAMLASLSCPSVD